MHSRCHRDKSAACPFEQAFIVALYVTTFGWSLFSCTAAITNRPEISPKKNRILWDNFNLLCIWQRKWSYLSWSIFLCRQICFQLEKLKTVRGSKLKTWNLWLCMNHSYRSPRHSMMYYDVIWVCQATNQPKRHWTFCWFQRENNGSLVFKVPNFKDSHRQFKTPCSSFSSMKSFNDFSHSWCLLHRKHSW